MNLLSGGEKTRVFLAGMDIHHPSVILMDEPTNHLDSSGRQRLYDWVEKYRSTLLVVSHDRTLLNLLPEICELEKHQINYYGGNLQGEYAFHAFTVGNFADGESFIDAGMHRNMSSLITSVM